MSQEWCIRVRGPADQAWPDCFEDMVITVHEQRDGLKIASLTGPVADQAALLGILHQLHSLSYDLLSAKTVEAH